MIDLVPQIVKFTSICSAVLVAIKFTDPIAPQNLGVTYGDIGLKIRKLHRCWSICSNNSPARCVRPTTGASEFLFAQSSLWEMKTGALVSILEFMNSRI